MINPRSIINLVIIAAIAAVSWHSVQEIHWLKTFYPHEHTIESAYQATIVEFIKVILTAFPLLLILKFLNPKKKS